MTRRMELLAAALCVAMAALSMISSVKAQDVWGAHGAYMYQPKSIVVHSSSDVARRGPLDTDGYAYVDPRCTPDRLALVKTPIQHLPDNDSRLEGQPEHWLSPTIFGAHKYDDGVIYIAESALNGERRAYLRWVAHARCHVWLAVNTDTAIFHGR